MTQKKKLNADCYSSGDRILMEKSQKLRAKWLEPVLKWLKENNLKADTITMASLVTGLLFTPLFLYSPFWALIALLLHSVLDGLDGPLARYTSSDSAKGSLTDTFSDQIIVATSTATLIMSGHLHSMNGTAYIFLYTLVITFSMIRNAMDIPYQHLVRPRFIVYLMVPISLYWRHPALNVTVLIFNIPLLFYMIAGYRRIRNEIAKY